MPQIDISDQESSKLEGLAPDYLKGQKKDGIRVRWAIEKLAQLLTENQQDSQIVQS